MKLVIAQRAGADALATPGGATALLWRNFGATLN